MPTEMKRNILITGANSGIGLATAKVLANNPANRVIMTGRDPAKISAAAATVREQIPSAQIFDLQLDIDSRESIRAAAKSIETEHGHLDALINNAGRYLPDADLETDLRDSLSTNVIGQALMTQAFEPLLVKSSYPYVLYISSGLGSMSLAEDASRFDYDFRATGYRVSKAALNMLVVEDSKRLGPRGVKVFAVCPGLVESNLRGSADAQVTAGGMAQPAETSGRFIEQILHGERDSDVGKFVHEGGLYGW